MSSSAEKIYDIHYDADLSCVIMKWTGYPTSVQVREGMELMLENIAKHKACKVLADVREMLIIGHDDRKWLEQEFLPRWRAKGFKVIAFVKPSNYFSAVTIESMLSRPVLSFLKINVFDTYQEAQSWLSQVKC
jgi:hypothetical protein